MLFKNSKKKKLETYLIANRDKLYKIAFIYLKNREDTLDIIQDSIVKSYLCIDKLKNIEALEKWFIRLLINTCIDFIRKNSKLTYLENEDIELVLNKEIKEEVAFEEIIESLDLELKGVISLKYFYGYKVNEISEILEISESHVKNKLQKALNLLRKEIKKEVV